MWFTRVSLKNPVFATMVMLALVVLGAFSYQRLKVDQFPNVDFPVVVITAAYPGASPEIVESEVTKKIEEGVNSIAGINALHSRSYEGYAVVIIEFQLEIDGRKAAEDVREQVAAIRPQFRTEVKEPRVMRFDPSSRPVWSVAVLPDASKGRPMSAIELTNWADQVLTKRLENVRGVGSITLVGGTKREINVYLNPVAMEALGVTRRPGGRRCRQREPGPAGRRDPLAVAGPGGADVGAHGAARGLRQDHRGAQGRGRRRGRRHAGAGGPGGAGVRRRPGAGQPGPVQRRAHAAPRRCRSRRTRTPSRSSTG